MRRFARMALAATALTTIAGPVAAQSAAEMSFAAAAQAEAAAIAAERAAAAAQAASAAATEAARAARAAANFERQRAVVPAVGSTAAAGAATTTTAVASPSISLAEAVHAADNSRLSRSLANGPNDSPLKAGTVPDAQLQVSEKDAVASIALSIDVGGDFIGNAMVSDTVVLRAFGNLKDGEAKILGLGGFSKGSGLSFGFTRYVTPVSLEELNKIDVADVAPVLAACVADPAVTDKKLCEINNPGNGGIGSLFARYDRSGMQARIDRIITGNTKFYGVDFKGSQASYTFLDRTAFKLDNSSKFAFSGSLFGGVIDRNGKWSITGFAEYGRTYSENDPVTLCQPLPNSVQTQCLTGADGKPGRDSELLVGAEWRQRIGLKGAPLAIAPRFTYDIESEAFSLAVPVYFASDAEGKLRGGLRGVYTNRRNDDNERKGEFALSLFVGVPFDIFTK